MLEYAVLRLCRKAGVTSPAATDLYKPPPTPTYTPRGPRQPPRPSQTFVRLRTPLQTSAALRRPLQTPYASTDLRTPLQTSVRFCTLLYASVRFRRLPYGPVDRYRPRRPPRT
ncbi:hypothetical protein F4803DRAFT_558000 [Xylaria telfairii]|nr:hypothetical protein F4803DRAFT_558000 [Xylaria telfairii]